MGYKTLFTVFSAVFIAELGDKTQLATLLFAADREVRWCRALNFIIPNGRSSKLQEKVPGTC